MRVFKSIFLSVAIFIPVGLCLFFISKYKVNAPFADDWQALVSPYLLYVNNNFALQNLFEPLSIHRLAVVRAIYFSL